MKELKEHIEMIKNTDKKIIKKISKKIINAYKNYNKILIFGNGGSAADAQHIAGEFVNRFQMERKPLPCIALTTDSSVLTSISNDYNYNQIFKKQIQALANKNDICIGISTSGNSKNVIKGIETAKRKNCITIGFTGKNGGKLKEICDICFQAQSKKTPRIQEAHITALHIICSLVENQLFGEPNE